MQGGRNKIRGNCRLCKNGNYPFIVKTITRSEIFAVKPFIFYDGLYYKKTDSSKRLLVVKKGTTDDIIKSINATFGSFEKRKQATN